MVGVLLSVVLGRSLSSVDFNASDGRCPSDWSARNAIIVTEKGRIDVGLYWDRAPRTACNFARYVLAGHYDGGTFFRTVRKVADARNPIKIDVVQADIRRHVGKGAFGSIPLERTSETGLLHSHGTLSMARSGIDDATSSFFICIGDQPELDFGGRRNIDGQGFAAFGRVVRGMDVVRRIHQSAALDERLSPPIKIIRVTLN